MCFIMYWDGTRMVRVNNWGTKKISTVTDLRKTMKDGASDKVKVVG